MTFQFFFGGYFEGHFEIVLKNDTLDFYVSDYPMRSESAEPTHTVSIKNEIDWQTLVEYLTALNWKHKYYAEILDGIQWELTFINGIKHLECFGSNKFPGNFGELTSLIKKITKKYKIPDRILG